MGENKRIAKNTIYLYFRSFLMMAIGIYSSRVILQALGIDDYGLYGAIGSMVAMFTMINGVLAVGTSRFLTFELGRNDKEKLKKTFSASFAMHVAMAIILLILLETVGLWFVNSRMNIPDGREFAANIVYQLSVLSCMLSLTQVPYSACIIAHEKMDIYAYVGIAEVSFKLLLVFLLLYSPFSDNLIAYSIIIACWSIALQVWYRFYCYRHFEESHLTVVKDKTIYKSMLSYSMWDFVGQFCATGNGQGINILINMFFGVAVNAARSVAFQVENAITQFSGNFLTSVNPQIVKNYASGNFNRFFQLIYEAGKYSYYLLFIVSLPIFLEADYILQLWLVEVPQYASLFLKFIMAITLFRVIARPVISGVHATGNVKVLNLTSGVYSAGTFLPAVYIAFRLGFPVWSCFIIQGFNAAICSLLEIRALYKQVRFDVKDYLLKVYAWPISVSLLASVIPALLVIYVTPSFGRLCLTVASCVISTSVFVYFLGLDKNTRTKVTNTIIRKLRIK